MAKQKRSDVVITLKDGIVDVIRFPEGVSVEVRDYDIQGIGDNGFDDIHRDADGRRFNRMIHEE